MKEQKKHFLLNGNMQPVYVSAALLLSVASCGNSQKTNDEAETPTKPNIIYIMSDDHASHAISAYGGIYDELAPTPNIDRLAKEGIKFNNVFCTNSISGPSRASILTGQYSHMNGLYKNNKGGNFDTTKWTFPQAMQQNGYQTALFGKWHLGSEPQGFDFYKYHDNPGQQGTYWDPVYNENGKKVDEKGYSTNLTADFAIDWLANNKNNTKPFCMMLHFKAPHREWAPDKKYEDLWEDIEMPYPTTFNDDYKGREKTAGDTEMTMDNFSRRDMKMKPPEGLTGEELQKWLRHGYMKEDAWLPNDTMTIEESRKWKYQTYIKDYLACIKSVDDNIGRVLNYLDENGLAENTIVIYTSDQGFYLGDHGWFDKRFIYEESLRMPFLVRYPAKVKGNQVNDDIIANIDFAPTLLEFAGIDVPAEVQGRSFADNILGNTPTDWQKSVYYHYYEFPLWHHVQPHYGIRNERYKLVHFYYSVDEWEFYDLEEDPDELINDINNTKYAPIIEEMKKELTELMKKYGNDKPIDDLKEITDKSFGVSH